MHPAGPGSHPGSRADSGDSGDADARETRAERAAKRAAQRVAPGQLAISQGQHALQAVSIWLAPGRHQHDGQAQCLRCKVPVLPSSRRFRIHAHSHLP